jgi:hypothetical protein
MTKLTALGKKCMMEYCKFVGCPRKSNRKNSRIVQPKLTKLLEYKE